MNHKGSFRFIFIFVSICFFASGAAGLVYEVLWVRMIDKVIGSAPFAVATVLSLFMGGLALGSYVAGKEIDRHFSKAALLSLFGKIEIAIGAYSLILPLLIVGVKPFYRMVYDLLLTHFWCYQAFSFLGCAILLIIPASLMGATLPVLCRFYVDHLDHLGTRTGWLYGLNTIGAAFGAILCSFLLINSLGVYGTLSIAAAINGIVGALCIILSQHKGLIPVDGALPVQKKKFVVKNIPTDNPSASPSTRRAMKWALWLFAISGFCGMAYEVLWTRLLGLLVGPTTYSFSIVISTFIIGLALGSIIFGFLADRVKQVFHVLIFTELCASTLALVVSQLLGNSQFLFSKLIYTFQNSFPTMIVVQSIVLFFILIGPTLFLGAAFPLVNRIYIQSISKLGKSLGTAYAINTVGAIFGSLVAGFFLVPLIGKEIGLRLIVMAQFSMALLALIHLDFSLHKRPHRVIVAAGVGFCFILLSFRFPSWNRGLLSRGWYRDFDVIEHDLQRTEWFDALWKGSSLLTSQRKGLEVIFYGEGIGGFTTVEKEITSLGTVEYALFNSGKADASSHGDRSTQTLSAHIPMLFHPCPKTVMVLGLASGMTSGEVLLYPIKQLDIVEINDQVVKACASFFVSWNNDCLRDSRTRLIIQDGRNHLALTREKYDVIISEPSNPWMAGLANLYTLEFFQLVKERLNNRGIFAQWIQSYEIDWETFSPCLSG